MDDLHITYNHGNGEMLIHLDYFFPCSQVRFNKLLKIIELDWQHEAELKENLKVHFQKKKNCRFDNVVEGKQQTLL